MQIMFTIPDKRVNYLIAGHSGSMSGEWLREWEVETKTVDDELVIVKVDAKWLDEDDKQRAGAFDRAAIQKGMNVMAKDFPNAFADFMRENDDDGTFDIAAQCIIFGKEVYG